jgi:hypothetical protein
MRPPTIDLCLYLVMLSSYIDMYIHSAVPFPASVGNKLKDQTLVHLFLISEHTSVKQKDCHSQASERKCVLKRLGTCKMRGSASIYKV